MSADPGLRWFAPPADQFDWRAWGDEVVVRDSASGSTHLLHPLAASLWLALIDAAAPLSLPRLAECWLGGTASAQEQASMADVLSELQRLGLAGSTT